MWIIIGRPDIVAKGAEDVLKLLVENFWINQAFSFGTISSVHGNGIWSGLGGVSSLGLTSFSSPLLSMSSLLVRDKAYSVDR